MHQSGRALIPALCVHVCPGLAVLGAAVQPAGVCGIPCIFACTMPHTDILTRYRVCQLVYCRTLGSCWQSIHESLLSAGSFGLPCELPVHTDFGGPQIATNRPQGCTPLLYCIRQALPCAWKCAVHFHLMHLYLVGTKVHVRQPFSIRGVPCARC